MKQQKNQSIRLLIAALLIGLCQPVFSQSQLPPGYLSGMMTVGDLVSMVNGDLVIGPEGELYMGDHSPRGRQINELSITGNYSSEGGSRIYLSVIDNTNRQNTKGYIDIVGTATQIDGPTSIILDMFDTGSGWDGSCITLARANVEGSDAATFRMDEMPQINGRIAVLRNNKQDKDIVWYIAEKLIRSQSTASRATCLNGQFDALYVVTAPNCSYQWYRCDADGGNFVYLGSDNGAQTAYFTPPATVEGESYYRCVVSGMTCATVGESYNRDTTLVSEAVIVKSGLDILTHPVKQIVTRGEEVTLGIQAEGAISYQWYLNGKAIDGATSDHISFTHDTDQIDEYYVEVIGACGDVVTSEKVTVGGCLPIIVQKRNHTLLVNNNSADNGGYEFAHYTWYKNDQLLHEGFGGAPGSYEKGGYYYTGGGNLNPVDTYYAVMIGTDGNKYQTCDYNPVIKVMTNITAYPVPLNSMSNYIVTVDAEASDDSMLEDATIDVFSSAGAYISRTRVTGRYTQVNMPHEPGVYVLMFKSSEINKEIKVIVE